MDRDECRRRFAAAAHAYLATVGPDGAPHLVPVVHAVHDDDVLVVVDHKPKRTSELRRVRNLRAEPRVAFLADRYDDDWHRLWWVRADAVARVVDDGPEHAAGVARLQARHPQYVERVPTGPLVVARVERWTGWSASG
jgi:PPOX class probable F420-dependent enzyme